MFEREWQNRLQVVRGQYSSTPWIRPRADESPLLRSWQRCLRHGLRETDRVEFELVSRSLLAELDSTHGELVRAARPETERLAHTLVGAGCVVLLTNHRGTIIDSLGRDAGTPRELAVASRKGVNLDERCIGTTAPSIVLAEGEPYLVGRDAHFCDNVRKFFCVAAPLHGPSGAPLGVLDITAYDSVPAFDVMSLVVDAARSIENALFRPSSEHLLVRFHSRHEFVGTPHEAIVAVAADGSIVGANRAALRLLGLSRPELASRRFRDLFDREPIRLLTRAMRGDTELPELWTHSGLRVFARLEAPAGAGAAGRRAAPGHIEASAAADGVEASADADDTLVRAAGGDASLLQRVLEARDALAAGVPVLLTGETGSGKEHLARLLVDALATTRPRTTARATPSAVDALLVVVRAAAPRLEAIDGSRCGTLLVDEPADLAAAVQAQLVARLAELPDGRWRVIATSQLGVDALQASGRVRADLLHRLAGCVLTWPALRDRADRDAQIAAAAVEAWRDVADVVVAPGDVCPVLFDDAAWARLRAHRWPGNQRELRQTMRLLALQWRARGAGALGVGQLPATLAERSAPAATSGVATMRELEREAIERALAQARGNVSAAARRLGISRNTLYRRLRERGRTRAGA